MSCSHIAASRDITAKFLRCPIGESLERTTHVVSPSPRFDELSGIFHIAEIVYVTSLGAQGSAGQFTERIVRYFAWTREVDVHSIAASPQIHQLTGVFLPMSQTAPSMHHVAAAICSTYAPRLLPPNFPNFNRHVCLQRCIYNPTSKHPDVVTSSELIDVACARRGNR